MSVDNLDETRVECPNCGEEFDAVAAARRRGEACPHCKASWKALHAQVAPDNDPADAEIEYPFDGPGGESA